MVTYNVYSSSEKTYQNNEILRRDTDRASLQSKNKDEKEGKYNFVHEIGI
jgi:hypothetical protein